jgi:hypothetical protein
LNLLGNRRRSESPVPQQLAPDSIGSSGGQIAEHWGVFDMLGILQQLGAAPA